jgi:hypothetical protein
MDDFRLNEKFIFGVCAAAFVRAAALVQQSGCPLQFGPYCGSAGDPAGFLKKQSVSVLNDVCQYATR